MKFQNPSIHGLYGWMDRLTSLEKYVLPTFEVYLSEYLSRNPSTALANTKGKDLGQTPRMCKLIWVHDGVPVFQKQASYGSYLNIVCTATIVSARVSSSAELEVSLLTTTRLSARLILWCLPEYCLYSNNCITIC